MSDEARCSHVAALTAPQPAGGQMLQRIAIIALLALALSSSTGLAQVPPFPASFTARDIPSNGTVLHVRIGGSGPAVVLLHGFGDTGDMWAPLAANLVRDHTVIVPDLRGFGASARPAGGYDKMTEAADIAGVLDTLHVARADVVAHDIGNMVAFAFAARYPDRITKLVLMDAPIPGVGPWDELAHAPQAWHFYFYGPDEERLVAGRERIYLDRFYNELSANPARIDEETRAHYATLYAQPGAMHAAFNQFAAFPQDAKDNRRVLAKGKLAVPVLAVGGGGSYGRTMAAIARAAFINVAEESIPDAGHWLMEEQPQAVIRTVRTFLDKPLPSRSG
jgi:pimeloyl-ACP methyl ester carboxylesterase